MNIRIIFSYAGGGCKVFAIPNLGFDEDKFGVSFVAPQAINDGLDWFSKSRYLGHGQSVGAIGRRGVMFILSVDVSKTGEAGVARIEKNFFATRKETKAALRAIKKSRFIPGFYKGEPHPMRYYESMGTGG
jgi:hypothetical protein